MSNPYGWSKREYIRYTKPKKLGATIDPKVLAERKRPLIDRFWSRVNRGHPDHCWTWEGLKSKGYGYLCHEGIYIRAHRLSYEIHNGEIPKGLLICHHCDEPSCVNPVHLFLGTNRDNMIDALRKGRLPKHMRGIVNMKDGE